MNKSVLIATHVHPTLTDKLAELGYSCEIDTEIAYESALSKIGQYEGIITSNKLPVNKSLLERAVNLKWVGRMGSGMEIIDTAYAAEIGVQCFSSPEGNANAVAEQALGMLLSLQHNVFRSFEEVRKGEWSREENRGVEIEGLTAGIIGLGNNGLAFARKLVAMGLNVLAFDKYTPVTTEPGVTMAASWQEMVPQCDIVSFHVPLNEETRHYFNEPMLNLLKQPTTLLNLSRGEIVNTEVLLQGMKSGVIKAAALDVWEVEPISKMPDHLHAIATELLSMKNFIGTPHIGGYSVQATYKMSHFLEQKITACLKLQEPGK